MADRDGFLAAVECGDAPAVAAMLAEDPGLATPRSGRAADPVALAARQGRLAVLRLLLEQGATAAADGTSRDTPTALMQAAEAGQQEAVALLLEHGADPALCDPEGRTAADRATAAGHSDLARRLRTDAEAERILR